MSAIKVKMNQVGPQRLTKSPLSELNTLLKVFRPLGLPFHVVDGNGLTEFKKISTTYKVYRTLFCVFVFAVPPLLLASGMVGQTTYFEHYLETASSMASILYFLRRQQMMSSAVFS